MSIKTDKPIDEWSLEGVLKELEKLHNTMEDRQFAFILGAGASVASGIPSGHSLAQQWLQEIHEYECLDKELDLNAWLENDQSGWREKAITLEDAGSHYPTIFERRFKGDREAGYAALETAMESKFPSLGYSLLASIIHHTRHKVVITTNFDNLVADALSMQAHQSPLIVAHESLAGFVRSKLRRPLIAKIHRDLFLNPINNESGVSTMEDSWKIALKKLFQYFTPIVIGYGGNDGSLMNMLNDLSKGEISGRIFWCYRGDKKNIPQIVFDVLNKHNGILVKIPSFDELMVQLAQKLIPNFSIDAIPEDLKDLGAKRAEQYKQQIENLTKEASLDKSTSNALKDSVNLGKSWWAWQLKAEAENDIVKRDAIYQQGMKEFPKNVYLINSYAIFLAEIKHDYESAEKLFKHAISIDPYYPAGFSNYAFFLGKVKKDMSTAQSMYEQAISLDPLNVDTLQSYVHFLTKILEDHIKADAIYKRIIEIEPKNIKSFLAYANFLHETVKNFNAAEELFKRAIAIDPLNVEVLECYAYFLNKINKKYDAATMYKKALDLGSKNAKTAGNYANHLFFNKDFLNAEIFYKKSLELDPRYANNIGNYALFLSEVHKDYETSEELFKKSIQLDGSIFEILIHYAIFLQKIRKDYDSAEAMYEKAFQINSKNSQANAIYAQFLTKIRKNYDQAEIIYKDAISIDPYNLEIMEAYAQFLIVFRKDYRKAEDLYEKIISVNANDTNALANYTALILIKNNSNSAKLVTTEVVRIINLSNYYVNQQLAEALLYGSLAFELFPKEGNAHMLSWLKYSLMQNFARVDSNFKLVSECIFPMLSSQKHTLYHALSEAILEESKLDILNSLPEWRDVLPINPFTIIDKRQ